MENRTAFDERVRFNWGYHDARFDMKHKLTNREKISVDKIAVDGNHPLPWADRAYCEGYHRGLESDLVGNQKHELSEWAWQDYSKKERR